eukprot:scaffold19949_cov120-Isochrysis_galbana.AAC.5
MARMTSGASIVSWPFMPSSTGDWARGGERGARVDKDSAPSQAGQSVSAHHLLTELLSESGPAACGRALRAGADTEPESERPPASGASALGRRIRAMCAAPSNGRWRTGRKSPPLPTETKCSREDRSPDCHAFGPPQLSRRRASSMRASSSTAARCSTPDRFICSRSGAMPTAADSRSRASAPRAGCPAWTGGSEQAGASTNVAVVSLGCTVGHRSKGVELSAPAGTGVVRPVAPALGDLAGEANSADGARASSSAVPTRVCRESKSIVPCRGGAIPMGRPLAMKTDWGRSVTGSTPSRSMITEPGSASSTGSPTFRTGCATKT